MKRLMVLIAVLGILSGFCFGMGINKEVIKVQYVDRLVVQYVETSSVTLLVESVVYKEEPVEIHNGALRFPRDRAELGILIDKSKVEEMGEQRCVAEAVASVRRAEDAGYLVSWQARFGGAVEPDDEEWGMFNSTFIGQTLWFYNPVTGQAWPAGHSINPVE